VGHKSISCEISVIFLRESAGSKHHKKNPEPLLTEKFGIIDLKTYNRRSRLGCSFRILFPLTPADFFSQIVADKITILRKSASFFCGNLREK